MNGSHKRSSWICPNDRELALRAKLDVGWCVKSGSVTATGSQISEHEQQSIIEVLKRSQEVERREKERINKLQDRINNMKRNARGDGYRCCALCNDQFGLFAVQCHQCKDCNKSVCSKCGFETISPKNEPNWLCKICSETREVSVQVLKYKFHFKSLTPACTLHGCLAWLPYDQHLCTICSQKVSYL